MSWRDRDYNQGDFSGGGILHPLLAILNGAVPLGRWFSIRVRVHASLILFIGLTLLLDYSQGYPLHQRLLSMSALFAMVLLHEFGHCFTARAFGGTAEEILMWPLGGLAYTNPPHRPGPTFLTAAAGPLVNATLCLLVAIALWSLTGHLVSLNPFHALPHTDSTHWPAVAFFLHWTFFTSYILLLFNLLPIYPLDGGQMLQAALWPKLGFYKASAFAYATGMVGAVALAVVGLILGKLLLVFVAVAGFIYCLQRQRLMRDMGEEFFETMEYNPTPGTEGDSRPHHHRRLSRRAIRRIQRCAQKEQFEQARIDSILDKVSAHGLRSLSWWERRALRRATLRQRQRDLELARVYRDGESQLR
ncbi:MAG TPA: site-2 protease family protein [Tepidisphaeraceae bacterium]|nr:site-2 protease family protein [Tepidisphaeraceae bacterium]